MKKLKKVFPVFHRLGDYNNFIWDYKFNWDSGTMTIILILYPNSIHKITKNQQKSTGKIFVLQYQGSFQILGYGVTIILLVDF